ncbi:hypothetical protein WDW89_18260 [Deltaproteobacteria bacterium TL4]
MSAIQLSAIYASACEREIGIILNVDDATVKMLNLSGDIKSIRRFDIIYIAEYPVGKVNIPKIEPSEDIKIVEIKTLFENQVVDLLKGWLTNYSDRNMSFLTTDGIETVIDINNIWNISFTDQKDTISFNGNDSVKRFHFVHPYPFISCELDQEEQKGLSIYPDHLLETPLLIKIELDRLQLGYEKLQTYVKEKVFYPEPQIFTNITTLGIWASSNLRYGSSSTRNSSFIPVVRSELSEGLFKFQRVVVTGTAPMPYSVHEEPQTQLYYSMKSSYFHMSLMYDLGRLLVGDGNYKWQLDDLKDYDDRQNEKMHIGGGFDYGNFSIEYTSADINFAVRHDDLFYSNSFSLNRTGLFYRHRLLKVAFYSGFSGGKEEDKHEKQNVASDNASEEEKAYIAYLNEQQNLAPDVRVRYQFFRLNLEFSNVKKLKPHYSMLYRNIDFELGPGSKGASNFMYEGEALTNAVYLRYELTEEDLFFEGFISIELLKNKSSTNEFTQESRNNYLKSGVSIGLVF